MPLVVCKICGQTDEFTEWELRDIPDGQEFYHIKCFLDYLDYPKDDRPKELR